MSEAAWPSVTVIVPMLNEADRLPDLLAALADQDYPGEVEMIVVDNGSDDGSQAIVEDSSARLLVEPEKSSYKARNKGLAEAQGEIIAFADADCRPAPAWVRQAVGCLRDEEADVVAGRVRTVRSSRWNLWEAYDAGMYLRQPYYVEHGCATTANLVVRREVFDEVGVFPEVQTGGDMTWTRRATDAGFRLVYCEQALVEHPARASFSSVMSKEIRFISESGVGTIVKSMNRREIYEKVHADRSVSLGSMLAVVGLMIMKNALQFLAAGIVLYDMATG